MGAYDWGKNDINGMCCLLIPGDGGICTEREFLSFRGETMKTSTHSAAVQGTPLHSPDCMLHQKCTAQTNRQTPRKSSGKYTIDQNKREQVVKYLKGRRRAECTVSSLEFSSCVSSPGLPSLIEGFVSWVEE